MTLEQAIGAVIAEWRADMKVSQSRLAENVGTDQGTIARIEQGHRMNDHARLEAIAESLGDSYGCLIFTACNFRDRGYYI